MSCKRTIFFLILILFGVTIQAQIVANDTTQLVEILPPTKNLEIKKLPDGSEVQILSGGVRLRQGNTLFTCDSCVLNNVAKTFLAFGHVHINDGDTTQIWSNTLRYLYDKKYAYLDGAVRLNDGQGTLTTNTLEYDVARKIGVYRNGGKVVNKRTTVTSREGIYYADIKDIYFKNDVLMKDPANTVKTDSILYNTETQTARFISKTTIKDSTGRVITTTEGTYDLISRKAEFTQRTTIVDKSLTVTGDEIKSDDSTGIIQIR
ncbi:MAG: LPS export ABC transporter periplasmic protein LptC, partial [Bacteroidota bacterium]|nr:LPS export ABC transporter periplasmic protein LptC [Bacteroidota bacterium]